MAVFEYIGTDHGTVFAHERESFITLRFHKGEWSASPIGYIALEHEMAFSRDIYPITESDAMGITGGVTPDECFQRIKSVIGEENITGKKRLKRTENRGE
ncbi:MAG: hypothetical protein IKB34_03030 [Clostridia bacterium]|nr:hypothetical protein [Clostridia bacterium]